MLFAEGKGRRRRHKRREAADREVLLVELPGLEIAVEQGLHGLDDGQHPGLAVLVLVRCGHEKGREMWA